MFGFWFLVKNNVASTFSQVEINLYDQTQKVLEWLRYNWYDWLYPLG